MGSHAKGKKEQKKEVKLAPPSPTNGVRLPPGPGRPPGSRNKIPRLLQDAILMAAELHGDRAKGKKRKEGLVEYLGWVAMKYPEIFAKDFIARLLPMNVKLDGAMANVSMTPEQFREELAKRELPTGSIYMIPPPKLVNEPKRSA